MRRRPIEQGLSNDRTIGGLASKVPHVTLAFWVIKLLATTLGETGGDALSVSLDLGYAVARVVGAHPWRQPTAVVD